MSTRILVFVLLLMVAPSTAEAKPRRMTFDQAVLVARDYWMQHGVSVPCAPRRQLLTWRETASWNYSVDMLADVDQCAIEITPWANIRRDRLERMNYCWDIVHEVGHLAGLEHPDAPAALALSTKIRAMLPHTVMGDGAYPYGCRHPRRFLRRSIFALRRDGPEASR